MKLTKKLIPLFATAVTASAIVPFTACSNNAQWDEINGMATPTFVQYEPGQYIDNDIAQNAYVEFMSHNRKDFVKDMKWGIYQNWLSFYDNSNYAFTSPNGIYEMFNAKIKSLKCYVSQPTFGTVEINTGKLVEPYPTMSFKMGVDVEATVTNCLAPTTQKQYTTHNFHIKSESSYKNMLFFAYPATRNDKTHGSDYIKPSEMAVDTTKPGWFITISEDTDVQYKYRRNFSDWGIDYTFDLDDTIEYKDAQQKVREVRHHQSSYKNVVDTYTELENLIDMKTYHYDLDSNTGNKAWNNWFLQKDESIIANSVLLDCVSHYLNAAYSKCYMYVPEHISTTYTLPTAAEQNFEGALYYPNSDFTYEKRNDYELTLEVYDLGGNWIENAVIDDVSRSYDPGKIPQLTLNSGKVITPTEEQWLIWKANKGAAEVYIPGTVDPKEQTGIDFNFIIGSKANLKFNLHPASSQGDHGVYPGGQDFDIQFNDGSGWAYVGYEE